MESAFTVKLLKYHRNRPLFRALSEAVERLISILAITNKRIISCTFFALHTVYFLFGNQIKSRKLQKKKIYIYIAASSYHLGHCCGFCLPLYPSIAGSTYHHCGVHLPLFCLIAASTYHISSLLGRENSIALGIKCPLRLLPTTCYRLYLPLGKK